MTEKKRRVLLVGLEDALLWQLTRSLVQEEPRIEYHCAMDFSIARELCAETFFHYIVMDGWMQSWQAGYSIGWDELSRLKPWKWIVLVDSLPMGGLLDERILETAVFLEKPFNPKEFPTFLRNLEAGRSREIPAVEADAEKPGVPPLPMEPGESYRTLDPDEATPGEDDPEPPPEEAPGDDFHTCLEQGLFCLRCGDQEGARSFWKRALALRPGDKRVQANLKRLEKGKALSV